MYELLFVVVQTLISTLDEGEKGTRYVLCASRPTFSVCAKLDPPRIYLIHYKNEGCIIIIIMDVSMLPSDQLYCN